MRAFVIVEVSSPRLSAGSLLQWPTQEAITDTANREYVMTTTAKRLSGKNALITGGSTGIGLATAKRFVDEGAYVFITGRREPALNSAINEIGGNVGAVRGDVTHLGDLDRLFAQIKREKAKLDVVFANAGFASFAPLGEDYRGGLRLALQRQR
jgi:NAD(P)-dependent dehydrogenase (short-subunit alcohol dehydrogenase family)